METIVCIPGYTVIEEIYTGNRTSIYRALREIDRYPVTIELLRNPFPSFHELLKFRHKYEIGKDLDLPYVIKTLALEPYRNSYALVLEDCGGISLKSYLQQSGAFGDSLPKVIEFLQIAIQIAQAMEGLYCHRVIHKDIKPANILIHPQTHQIELIDFSISSLLPKETQEIKNANMLEGTLAYIAPEQTGRMNRGIDYRSDYYALGVTFYELLTGQLPFISTDPLELVHSHLAKQPLAVRQLKTNTPLMVSQLVSKLMSKNAEDRYQNALGLKHDLEICLAQLQQHGKIDLFDLGERDLSDRFLIPEKLYGREPEVATLLNAFERVSKGIPEIMLVAGASGIGKTVVIREVHKPIVRQRGYFINGKYDQFQRNIPFSAFVQAFRNLIGQLLCESDLQLQTWKTQILAAVGEHGQVLIDVIPELELIIGGQLPAPELSGSAAQQRFQLLMQKFMRLFSTAAHPLVLFLDDLQWADLASLNLLQSLMQDVGYLLVLGAYRDNEVSPIHPAILAIDEIEKTGITVNTITLRSLDQADLNQLVADTLSCDLLTAQPLAELVALKTQGNPFFATQFLKALYEDGLISFDRLSANGKVGGWSCDLTQVRSLAVTDDVVAFMALQLQKLPIDTQVAIALAACIGAQFDLNTLAIVLERSPAETAAALWSGLQENFLMPTTDIYKFFNNSSTQSASKTEANPVYSFLHDRVQQAAYSLISEDQRPATHLKIGQLLQQNYSETVAEEKLFDIVGHLNIARDLVTDLRDRQRIVDLNLNAGKKARNSTAYAAANIYFQIGIELLEIDCWETQYQLTLDLHIAATEAAYLAGKLDRMEEIAAIVIRSARTILDRVEIYRIQIAVLTASGKGEEAIYTGATVLSQLGFELPTTPTEAKTVEALEILKSQLQSRQVEDLLDLPAMSDLQARLAMELLADLSAPIFTTVPQLMPILSIKMVSLSIQFGNIPASAMGYANYGFVLSAFFGDVDTGYRFGKLALALVDALNTREFQGRISFLFATWIQHRQEPIRSTIPTLKHAYAASMESGDLLAIGYGICCYFDANLLGGVDLNILESEISAYSTALERIKQYSAMAYLRMKQQVIINLTATGSQPECLSGAAYDETVMIPKHIQDSEFIAIAYVHIYKLMLAYLFGNHQAAVENISQGEQYLPAISGMISAAVFHFYAALTYLALASEQLEQYKSATLFQVEIYQATIFKLAQETPTNYLHKWQLIEAEKQRVLGDRAAAIEYYDLAIAGAKEHQFIHEEALANELATKFYLDWGKDKIAQSYAIEAYYAYDRWGATAKCTHLTTLYPQLLAPILTKDRAVTDDISSTIENSITGSCEFLDLNTMLKASQAISEEIKLDRIITSLLEIVVANAGADKCILLLKTAADLNVVAKVELGQQPQLLAPISFRLSPELAISVIDRVQRSLEPILLSSADYATEYHGDLYLHQHQPKSVLCCPIVDRGRLIGVLYLENQLMLGAFTRDRLDILKVIVAQAAISIENARLYTELEASFNILERKVEERTIELKAAKELAEAADRSKTSFFTNMSHELRTPLNAILGMSEGLTELVYGQLNQRQLRCIEVIANSGNHLLQLIDDILDLAKIEAGKFELYCTPTNIADLCHESLSFVNQQSSQKNIQLTVNLPPQLPELIVDELRIRQVLINLLSNAVKFTPEDGRVSLEVSHHLATAPQATAWIQFAVVDSGIGIAPEDLSQLFQPFVQIDNALSRQTKGTGLGLNLVREIVELHGGRVGVSSQINVGSRFTLDLPCGNLPFIFPLATAESADESAISSPNDDRFSCSWSANPPRLTELLSYPSPDRLPSRKPPILIVDDDRSTIETLTDYLEAKGYTTIFAQNGLEAIELAQLHHPEAILMDIHMPILDGLAAISQLRSDPYFERLPIIALTALTMSGDRERCLEAGANEYLAKPITLGILAATIQELIA
ncbi:AAA family ATPase [Chamaesiphon sp. OTE_8_metabat_110]|uniref:ATP-binding response regulator n=1 Tax=Chamaesiphon sp. OTE_8_metabat_110 TaxID=2964696 RepID=UPI00286A0562|nr:AAA family ATPase [Chamaesiphon sp. OTE_8_metabat_110]